MENKSNKTGKTKKNNNKLQEIEVESVYKDGGKDINELMVQYIKTIMTLKTEGKY